MVCGQGNPDGLELCFSLCQGNFVETTCEFPNRYQGYEGLLHGGLISSLLDGAMANCLFAHGIVAVTAELKVRFLRPIHVNSPLRVRACLNDMHSPLFVLGAEIFQGEEVKAKANGKFIKQEG